MPAEAAPAVEPAIAPQHQYALKEADSFIVTDETGDIRGGAQGLFCNDTRLLSRLELELGGRRPTLLSASVSRDNVMFTAHFTNRPLPPLGGRGAPEGVIHIERARFLWGNRLYEHLSLRHYGGEPVIAPLSLRFDADFRDMFEVRGATRAQRGTLEAPEASGSGLRFAYRGLDGLRRTTQVSFSLAPLHHDRETGRVEFELPLAPHGSAELYVEVGAEAPPQAPDAGRWRTAAAAARQAMRSRRREGARLKSSSRLFNEWIEKSRADLALLTSDLPTGPYPYAGIPWFSTPFGRDAVITALQTLWLDERLARGVLNYLAGHQARHWSSFQDSAPGKILHETRKGEMAALREVPFSLYYGGVDTTPLFVMLAGAYARRSGDFALIDKLWPALTAAISWIEAVCDAHPLGLLDYARGQDSGLANQGWKDSDDSVFHADGRLAQGPIALVEVQGYVYAALEEMTMLARRRGEPEEAERWGRRAERLRATVEEHYWMADSGDYGLALDGSGALCRVHTTNSGHLLYCGLPDAARAQRVIARLLSPRSNSGWGLRTVAAAQARFNPMAYHNGSVWPHDTALAAAGMARYGERDGVARLTDQMFEAAVHFGMRLPELFCGFARRGGEPPTAYPVACLPQAWAAGSLFMLLQACLGIEVDGLRGEVRVRQPRLPAGIDRLALQELRVGDDRLHLVFQRIGGRVAVFRESGEPGSVHLHCLW